MGDRRRGGRRKDDEEEATGMTKEVEAIAKFVRFNCPTETTLFQGNEVHYFTGSKAVDTLYNSTYGTNAKKDARFSSRAEAAEFLQTLMDSQLFWRARKLVAKKKEDKDKKAKGDVSKKSPVPEGPKKRSKKKEEESAQATETEELKEAEDIVDKKEEEKKKKKVKLEVYNGPNLFLDDKDVYVWVYDPTPLKKKIIGLLMVVGTIVGCMFPLWPMWLRQGIYYLSMGGIGFFGVIIAVAILRTLLFGLIWLVTGGEHKLWVLPNLTEDVGFFESFQPFYTYERASQQAADKKEKKSKGKKEKDSDAEEEKATEEPKAVEEVDAEEESSAGTPPEGEGDSTGSVSDEQLSDEAEEEASSAPDTPAEAAPRRRRPKKDDGDFVMVSK